ncbi:MAG: peptidylprolyl isomerase [Gammaproteobacteria bacterium]
MKRLFPYLASMLLALAASSPAALAVTGSQQKLVPLDRIVAVVNDDVILKSELDDFVNRVKVQLRGSHTALPPERVLERQALERLVLVHLQLQLAKQTGIRVDDETLNSAIQDIAKRNGLTMDQFRQALEQDGFSFARFRENIRDQIMITRLQQRNVDNRIQVSKQEVDSYLADPRNRNDNRAFELQHILIALPEAASPARIEAGRAKAAKVLAELRQGADFGQLAVAVSDGQKALEGGKLGWFPAGQVPSLFLKALSQMKPGDISGIIRSPSGFHIIKLMAVRGAKKHIIEQTHVRHILIRTNEVVSDSDARNQLEQLRQRILNGDSFAQLARSHSEDTMSARNGGDLGWIDPGQTAPEFEREMNKLAVGQVSQPFKSRFGWHLVQVLGRRKFDDTQQYRRAQAREAIRARKRQEALELWLRRLRDEAYVQYRLNS